MYSYNHSNSTSTYTYNNSNSAPTYTYNSPNSSSVCQWHHNPQIIGFCPQCGAYICPKCALLLPDKPYQVCPNCFKTEYTDRILSNEHRRSSAITLTVLGLLFTMGLFIFAFLSSFKEYGILLGTVSWGDLISALDDFTDGYIILLPVYIIGFLFTIFCSLGFFLGLRSVFRWFRKLPIVIIVFSVIFFTVVIIFALQIAWWIGGFVMIREFVKIRDEKKLIQAMTDTMSAYI